jgi:hypothetical protein
MASRTDGRDVQLISGTAIDVEEHLEADPGTVCRSPLTALSRCKSAGYRSYR